MAEVPDRSDGEFPMKLAVCTKHGEWWQLNLSPVAPCPHPGCRATTLIYSRVGVYTPAPDPLEARDVPEVPDQSHADSWALARSAYTAYCLSLANAKANHRFHGRDPVAWEFLQQSEREAWRRAATEAERHV